MKNWD